jgi:hypothetical protein
MDHRVTYAFASQYRNGYLASLSICILSVTLVCLASAMYGCSSAIELSSAWRDREVVVDGSDSDWQGATTYIKGSNLALGIRNDNDYLYTCVIMMDRQMQMQMMASGFTVWFDPEGGKNRAFGIHFPLGMQGQQPPTALEGRTNPEEAQKLIEQSQRELEIIGPGKEERERIHLMQAHGINAKLGTNQEFLVYELKVPLRGSADHPYAIGMKDGQAVGIGFETAELNREMMKEQFGGMGRGGGGRGGPPTGGGEMPPGGGGPPSGGPPGMGSPGGGRPESLKLWTRVQLAPGNTSTAK